MIQKAAVFALIVIGLLCWTFGVASAQEKTTAVFYAWDSVANKYQNSTILANVNATPTGVWVPLLHHVDFDTDLYSPMSCSGQPNTSTMYAGKVWLGLYSTDNATMGARGFTESRKWSLVACDRDLNGSFDNGDLSMAPPTDVTTWDPAVPAHVTVISQDVTTGCTTGNCLDEIVTTLEINLDMDCDGVIDAPVPAGGLCFYAEGFLSNSTAIPWKGPLQGRFTDVAGDKTVNFEPFYGTTSVNLVSLTAKSPVAMSGLALIGLGILSALGMVWVSLKTYLRS